MPTHTQSNHVTRGGQITFHSIHMFFQVHNKIAKIISIGVLLLSVLFTWILSPDNAWQAVFYTLRNHLYDALNMAHDANVTTFWNGQRYVSTLGEQLNNAELGQLYDAVIYRFQVAFLIAFFMGMATFIGITLYFKRQGEKQSEDRHIRGFQLVDPKTMSQDIKARAKRKRRQGVGNGRVSSFRIDGHALFKMHFEVQHCLFDGTTGAGKSVGMRKLVNWIRARGDKAVIYDKGCTFTSEYFDASTDTLLNPFDKRCANWDIWCDAFEAPDFESMASALIPQHGDGDPFWVESARTIFSSTAYRMMKDTQGECTTERLLHLMLTSELETLGTYLKGIQEADDRFTGRAIKNITDAVKVRAMDFELPDEWMENPELFLFKDYDTKKAMIEDMRQPITVEMVIQEINRYADSEFRYADKSDEIAIENAVRDMGRMAEAKKRYLEGEG